MALFSKSKKTKAHVSHTLLVTVRSTSVTASLIDTVSIPPKLELMVTSEFGAHTKKEKSAYTESMLAAVKASIDTLIAQVTKRLSDNHIALRIQKTHVVLQAPWYKIITRDIVIERDDEFEIDEKDIDELMEKEMHLQDVLSDDTQLIEKTITHVLLNGYELLDPFKKKTKHITISLYAGIIDTTVYRTLQHTIRDIVSVKKPEMSTFPLVAFTALRDKFLSEKNYLLLNVTGTSTECTFVIDGAIAYHVILPLGPDSDIVSTATSEGEAVMLRESIQHIVHNDVVSNQNTLTKKLDSSVNAWIALIKKQVQTHELQIPKRIFVVGTAYEQALGVYALKSVYAKENIFDEKISATITPITPYPFKGVLATDDMENPSPDICLQAYFALREDRL
jgi:hypothetical protein